MRILKSRRGALAVVGTIAAVGFAGAAFAYFTASGSGSGTGAAGSNSALTLHGTVASSLYPGTSAAVSFTVDNPSSGHQYVNKIHLVNVTTDAAHSTCDTSDFTMSDVTAAQDFAAGDGQAVTAGGTLAMANTNVSQDGCQGAPLTLHLTSN